MASCSSTISIMKEMKKLIKKPLDDIEVMIKNESNVSIINALISGPEQTPFENGRFEIELHFTGNYPQQPPKGYFLTKIFHPNVAPNTGEICVNTLKKDWKPSYGIKHILIAIRSLLIVPNYDSALNEDAGKLLLTSYDSFVERAKLFTKIHAIPIQKKKKKTTGNVDSYHGDKENLNNQTDAETQNTESNKNQCDLLKTKQVNEEENSLNCDENNQHNKNHKNEAKSKKKSKSNHKHKSKVSKSMRRL